MVLQTQKYLKLYLVDLINNRRPLIILISSNSWSKFGKGILNNTDENLKINKKTLFLKNWKITGP